MNQSNISNAEFVLHIKNFVNTAIELPMCEREREADVMASLEMLGRAGKKLTTAISEAIRTAKTEYLFKMLDEAM